MRRMLAVRPATDVVVQTVTIEPGGTSGWHTHPGGEVLVRQGHPHVVRNEGPEPVGIVGAYVDVPPGAPADEPVPCAGP